jgi:cysteine-S-conjugate beta-lyase
MNFDFDSVIPRENTNSVKFDLRKLYFGREDVIPMWVADMDFAVPPFVSEAVLKRAGHPVYGYSIIPDSYYQAVIDWQLRRFGWDIRKDWIMFSPGVVTGLNVIVQALTEPGDKIIVQPPVYFPFFSSVENNGRKLILNQLMENNGIYSIDFEDLESKMKDGAKMLILCSPHNPVGRCWTREELEWIGAKGLEHGVLIVSDEIHCDLVFEPHKHIPMASISGDIANNTITCIAPSKTFNLAGLFSSSVIISNDSLRRKFKVAEEKVHLSANLFGITAAEAAYSQGDVWLKELMAYLQSNINLVQEHFAANLPEVVISPAEATYMLWLDFRRLGIPAPELKKRLIEKAGLGLVEGPVFGAGGEGFQRINIACPESTLLTALERFHNILDD